MKSETFEQFPWWMLVTSNSVGLAIYALGLYLMARLGLVWGVLYAAFCIWLEWRVLSKSCRSCYYYGKRCAFGKGKVCSWLFDKGVETSFGAKGISWRDIVPDFLVPIIPFVAGIVLLIRNFSWLLLLPVVALVLLGSMGTSLVRSRIACKYCKQRELGCPAEQLFSKPS